MAFSGPESNPTCFLTVINRNKRAESRMSIPKWYSSSGLLNELRIIMDLNKYVESFEAHYAAALKHVFVPLYVKYLRGCLFILKRTH